MSVDGVAGLRQEMTEHLVKLTEMLRSAAYRQLPEYRQILLKREFYVVNDYVDILNARVDDIIHD